MQRIAAVFSALFLVIAGSGCVSPKPHARGMRGKADFPAVRAFEFHGSWTADNGSGLVLREDDAGGAGFLQYQQAATTLGIFPQKTNWSGRFEADDEKAWACVTAKGTASVQKSKVLAVRLSSDGKTVEVRDWGEKLGYCDPGQAAAMLSGAGFETFYAYSSKRPVAREGYSLLDSLSVKGRAAGERSVSLLVAGFKSSDIGSGMTDFITEIVVKTLAGLPGVSVLTKEDIKTMLSHESERQLFDCSDDSCMVEIGGALGAPYLVYGKVIRPNAGNLFVSIKLLDVKAGVLIGGKSVKVMEKKEDEMIYKVSDLVKNLLRGSGKKELVRAAK